MRLLATLRERNLATAVQRSNSSQRRHNNNAVAVQLDYYMSPQFGGVASALVNNHYKEAGLSDLRFLPTCPPGLEQARVRQHANSAAKEGGTTTTTLGVVEQNIFIPTLAQDPSLQTTAMAAMFRTSPLCVASLRPLQAGMTIGAHSDTVELLQGIFPHCRVVASPRANKNTDLLSGELDAIQAYTTTEVPTLQRLLQEQDKSYSDKELCVTPLEGHNGTKLGYSQVLFAADECLQDDRRYIAQAFLEATFRGWKDVIQDPEMGIKAVQEAQRMSQLDGLGLDDESNDHWYPSEEFQLQMLELCNAHVKHTFQGDRHGVIHPRRWKKATEWLLDTTTGTNKAGSTFGLDSTIWQPPSHLLAGNELGLTLMEDAHASAEYFYSTHNRKPSLAVITVGDRHKDRYQHPDRRLQLFSHPTQSWFSKTATGQAHGFDVKELDLGHSTTTDDLLSHIYKLQKDNGLDGIQVMWPLPDHIDTARVYNAIEVSRDVDGMKFIGQLEIGNEKAYPPVSPAGAMALLKEYNVDLAGKRALVIGRSPIVGSPMAHMLRQEGAVVTVAHSETGLDLVEQLVRESEILVTAAGQPGLVSAEWIASGASVINIGSTFVEDEDVSQSDVAGDMTAAGCRYSPVPGGVGPLGVPSLFQNVVRAAWDRMNTGSAIVENTWMKKPATLRKSFHFPNYTAALEFTNKVNQMSTIMDHHANMTFSHQCDAGVDVTMEFFTFDAGEVTEKDYDAARAVDLVYGENEIRMIDYSYDLKDSSIAVYPANPRGSSKFLHLNVDGEVSYYENFSESFKTVLPEGAHVVFNESRVLNARLFVGGNDGNTVELMILDLGSVNLELPSKQILLQAMIRLENIKEGDVVEDKATGTKIQVEKIIGIWEEDEKSDGNGTECLVRVHSDATIDTFLNDAGSVPIPPYFQREAEPGDQEAYNNVYAATGGSVASPTAGLHFTQPVLDAIGEDSCSYVTLHVGAGTFKPVLSTDARDHDMHAECFQVKVSDIRKIIAASKAGRPLVVVGTTSARTLESLFWLGVKRIRGLDEDSNALELGQFEWAPLGVGEGKIISREAAFQALIDGLDGDDVINGQTSLMITPGHYNFKCVDHLVTNFHAPDSTLMLLVSAFVGSGSTIHRVYKGAQKKDFKFLSYGDVCMLSQPGKKQM